MATLSPRTMRRNTVKASLKAGKPVVGCWLNLTDVGVARFMARAGFDYLCVVSTQSNYEFIITNPNLEHGTSKKCYAKKRSNMIDRVVY